MTARCHNDTCSIEWNEVNSPSPTYEANVLTDAASATPTIDCGDDGLEVKLSTAAGQILSVDAVGLFANLPEAVVDTISGNPDNNGVAPSADSASPQDSDDYSWTNATGRDALVLVSGEFNFRYGILEDAHTYSYGAGNGQRVAAVAGSVPYNAMVAMRFLAKIGSVPTGADSLKATRVDIGGLAVTPTAGTDRALVKTSRIPFFAMIRVAAGEVLHMKSQAFFEGPDQTVNLGAAPGVGGADLTGSGHELWNLQVSAVPL